MKQSQGDTDQVATLLQPPPFDPFALGLGRYCTWWHFILDSGRHVYVRDPYPEFDEYGYHGDHDGLFDVDGSPLDLDDDEVDEFDEAFQEEFRLWDWHD